MSHQSYGKTAWAGVLATLHNSSLLLPVHDIIQFGYPAGKCPGVQQL
jgi:hypothetical protein